MRQQGAGGGFSTPEIRPPNCSCGARFSLPVERASTSLALGKPGAFFANFFSPLKRDGAQKLAEASDAKPFRRSGGRLHLGTAHIVHPTYPAQATRSESTCVRSSAFSHVNEVVPNVGPVAQLHRAG